MRFMKSLNPDRICIMSAVEGSVMNKPGLKAGIEFGISRAAASTASRGLNVFVLFVGRMVNRAIEQIDAANMKSAVNIFYEVKIGKIA